MVVATVLSTPWPNKLFTMFTNKRLRATMRGAFRFNLMSRKCMVWNSTSIVITSLSERRHGRLRRRLPEVSTMCFFNSGVKYLQNSSRIQKILMKFAVVIGVSVICVCLIFTYKGTNSISLL